MPRLFTGLEIPAALSESLSLLRAQAFHLLRKQAS